MRNKKNWALVALVAMLAFGVGQVTAQDGGEATPAGKAAPAANPMAMMVGDWDIDGKMFQNGQEMPFKATVKASMVMGGVFLQEEWSADFMGQPFKGRLITSMDPVTKEQVSVWIDNMSSGAISIMRGGEKDGVITLTGKNSNAQMGAQIDDKIVIKIDNADKQTHTHYMTPPGGQETKVMEFIYNRKKAAK